MKGGGILRISYLIKTLILILPLIATTPAFSKSSFDAINKDYIRFQKDANARKYRDKYENLIKRFKSFTKKSPKSRKNSQALFKVAQLREQIAQVTRSKQDFKRAERSYLIVASRFKEQKIGDRALLRAAKIRKRELKDKAGAIKLLKRFVPRDRKSLKKYVSSRAYLAKLKSPVSKQAKKKVESKAFVDRVSLQQTNDNVRIQISGVKNSRITKGEIKSSKNNPRRIFFDIKPARLASKIPGTLNVKQKNVRKIRIAQFDKNSVRIVAEVDNNVNAFITSGSNQIFLDLTNRKTRPKNRKPVLVQNPPPLLISKSINQIPRIVVLDPGHGGEDPGAIGRRGLKEKTITLAIAKRIKRVLKKEMPELKVYLTRSRDKTVSLSKRTRMANRLKADLFISIHANAARNRHAQGIETYYLNISHDRYAIRLAARENAMSESEVSNLEFILADLAMKSNVTDSIRLGQVVQRAMYSKVKERWRDTKNLGLKHALFYVLMGTRMPSILVETSFISNRVEEKRLRSKSYQLALARGVVKGIKRYVKEQQALYVP